MALGYATPETSVRLIDELVKQGKIDADLGKAIKIKFKTMPEIAQYLLGKNKVTEEDLVKASSVAFQLPFIHLVGKTIDRTVLGAVSEKLARLYYVIAYERDGNTLKIAVGKPYNLIPSPGGPLHELKKQKGIQIELAVTTMQDINWAMRGYTQPALANAPEPVLSLATPPPEKPKVSESEPPKTPDPTPTDVTDHVTLVGVDIPKDILFKFPQEIATKYQMIVFGQPMPNHLKVAVLDPLDAKIKDIVDFIQKRNQISIELYKTTPESIKEALKGYNQSQPAVLPTPDKPAEALTKDLPEGQSPETGGKSPEGITIIGSKEIQPVVAASLTAPDGSINQPENLEERNLDTFLGEPVKTIDELVTIIKSGFIPKTVAGILSYGIFLRASDIHLEALKNFFRLRYRVDGELGEYLLMPLVLHSAVISRIKILSNLKIDEQRIPQDGRYDAVANKHEFDVRVSSLPTIFGEKIVMRLLDKSSGAYTLEQLGFTGKALARLLEQLKKPWGVVLSTGPTGSGKSTTLYAILNRIATPKVNVITLEDPVEYEMKGVNQVQVKPKIGFSFAEGLRSVLRQDPNIIMVGEIRDGETAELATHAALTGHLVLTTLHTNNAAGTLPRLINMGVEPFLITSAVNAIIAQRLVRKLCPDCKQEVKVPEEVLQNVKTIMQGADEFDSAKVLKFYGPKGCTKCHSGFVGRIGIYEILSMSDKIEEAAIKQEPATAIEEIARKEGMNTMQQDGILKAIEGLTTLDEVLKVTTND